MKAHIDKEPLLKRIENLELIGITFIRGYIQFLFDGPILSTYTLPQIHTKNEIFTPQLPGYNDTLLSLIGKKVLNADEYYMDEKIIIQFESEIRFILSLKIADRVCAEAVMLQIEPEGEWNIW